MTETGKVFKYKLDFYYQSALLYLVTMILYGLIRGNLVEDKFEYVLTDPLMYVIVFFVVMSLVALLLNYIRARRLILTDEAIIFKNRFHERHIRIRDVEWIHIGREARVQTGGRFQVVVLKLKHRRRFVRIRIGRYERDKDLLAEMNRIGGIVPKKKYRRWQRRRITDR